VRDALVEHLQAKHPVNLTDFNRMLAQHKQLHMHARLATLAQAVLRLLPLAQGHSTQASHHLPGRTASKALQLQ
jgi:hypothetical protein